jgi:hypothetical protein
MTQDVNEFGKPREIYIDKAQLLDLILLYQAKVKQAKEEGKKPPRMPDTIGLVIERIAEGIAQRGNFRNYTFIDEMKRDSIVDCVKAVNLFDVNKLGKEGKPNPFGYLSRTVWYAFLGRIASEKKKHQTQLDMMFDPNTENFARLEGDNSFYDDGKADLTDFYYSGKYND